MSNKITNPLSNYSYINKDFNAVWSELLATVSKLSAKWDPNASNESDPGVVLIKLIALLADKCNYNIDVSALELFPSTVAQSANAREIFEQLGYSMKWYKSGTGTVTIKYVSSTTDSDEEDTSSIPTTITIPQFTMISDDDDTVVYTIKNSGIISTGGTIETEVTFDVIQGIITDYTYLGETQITAEQLDSHYRLYFTDNNVAQNGIFIRNCSTESWDEWSQVNNLNTQELLSKVYKFGVSRDGVPYIEFPTDIASLITDGIYVKYVISDGLSGNVASNVITKFYSSPTVSATMADGTESEITLSSDNTSISQANIIANGNDPETINSAYNNYSKTVGVFDTLVALRDYTNAIYNIGIDQELASNVIVSDRTNDIQSSYNIITKSNDVEYLKLHTALKDSATYTTSNISAMPALMKNPYDEDGTDDESINPYGGAVELALAEGEEGDGKARQASATTNPVDKGDLEDVAELTLKEHDITSEDYEITPFDLKMYLLQYVDYPNTANNFDKTFVLVNNNESETVVPVPGRINEKVVNGILEQIDEYKSIQHEFIPLLNNRPCLFLNKYPIKAIIIPQYKVTTLQASEISVNIYQALYAKYNAKVINFGEEVTYDDVYDTIAGADERIKSIILEPLEYKTYVQFYSTYGEDYTVTIDDEEYDVIDEAWNELPFTINTTIKGIDGNDMNWGIDCFAKSVLAGETELFKKKDAFKYCLNQKSIVSDNKTIANDVATVTTSTEITVPTRSSGTVYKVQDNENIYLQCPTYEDETNYSTAIKFEYYFKETGKGELEGEVKADTDYELKEGSYLILYWKTNDSDNYYTYKIYQCGDMIVPSGFSMDVNIEHSLSAETGKHPLVDNPATTTSKTGTIYSSETTKYTILSKYSGIETNEGNRPNITDNYLSSSKTITSRVPSEMTVDIDDDNYFYWILNTETTNDDGEQVYRIFDKTTKNSYYQLKTDEYFLITNKDLSSLKIYGSGTKISRTAGSEGTLEWNWDAPVSNVEDMNQIGVKVLKEVWQKLPNASKNCDLTMTQMELIVLGSGAAIMTSGANPYTLSNDPEDSSIPIAGDSILYKADYENDTEWTTITQVDLPWEKLQELKGWSMFSRLNVNLSANNPQVLTYKQSMTFTTDDGEEYEFTPSTGEKYYIQSSEDIEREGGENLSTVLEESVSGERTPVNIYGYSTVQNENETVVFENFTAKLLYNDDMKEEGEERVANTLTFKLPLEKETDSTNYSGQYLFPLYVQTSGMENLKIEHVIDETETKKFVTFDLLNRKAPNSVVEDNVVNIYYPEMGATYYIAIKIESSTNVKIPEVTLSFSIDSDYEEGKTQVLRIDNLYSYTEATYLDDDGNERYLLGDFFDDVLERMRELDYNGIYNYTHEVDTDTCIEDPLDPDSFNKANHVFNKFTICKFAPPSDEDVLKKNYKSPIVITNKIK